VVSWPRHMTNVPTPRKSANITNLANTRQYWLAILILKTTLELQLTRNIFSQHQWVLCTEAEWDKDRFRVMIRLAFQCYSYHLTFQSCSYCPNFLAVASALWRHFLKLVLVRYHPGLGISGHSVAGFMKGKGGTCILGGWEFACNRDLAHQLSNLLSSLALSDSRI